MLAHIEQEKKGYIVPFLKIKIEYSIFMCACAQSRMFQKISHDDV